MIAALLRFCFTLGLIGTVSGCFFGNWQPVVVGGSSAGIGLPSGSYQQSCQDCDYVDQVLTCQCYDKAGALRSTRMHTGQCGGAVANDDGDLICEGAIFPGGSYSETCKNCRLKGSTLICSCADRNGKFGRTRIKYHQCGNAGLQNQNGNLACDI